MALQEKGNVGNSTKSIGNQASITQNETACKRPQAYVDYPIKQNRAINKLARRMVNAQRAKQSDACKGSNRAEVSMDRYNQAAESGGATGRASKCSTCGSSHGLMSTRCQQLPAGKNIFDQSSVNNAASSSMLEFVAHE
jgi:hypothetical protein